MMKPKLEPTYDCDIYIEEVIDGDTVRARCDLGQDEWTGTPLRAIPYRLVRINAPEMNCEQGKLAKEHLIQLVHKNAIAEMPIGTKLLCKTSKMRDGRDRKGKYGRWLIELLGINARGDTININQRMMDDGFAEEYR